MRGRGMKEGKGSKKGEEGVGWEEQGGGGGGGGREGRRGGSGGEERFILFKR